MKDQQIEKAMDGIENRIRHIYNCGYQQGYEDGKKAVNEQAEITYTDIDEAYQRGYGDGRKAYMVDTIRQSDFSYRKGLEDAWKTALQIANMTMDECKEIFGDCSYFALVAYNFTADQAMKKIMDYESRKSDNLHRYLYGMTLDEMKENHGVWNVSFTLAKEPQEQEEDETEEEWDSETMSGQLYDIPTEQTEEIKVGDEVILNESSTWSGQKAIVIGVDKSRMPYHILTADGNTEWSEKEPPMKKTGRHFPQMAEVLEKMRKESE